MRLAAVFIWKYTFCSEKKKTKNKKQKQNKPKRVFIMLIRACIFLSNFRHDESFSCSLMLINIC